MSKDKQDTSNTWVEESELELMWEEEKEHLS